MKHLFGLLVLGAAVAPALPQTAVRQYSSPKGLSSEALDRLNLTTAWRTRVPTEGMRDGLLSVQLIPGEKATGYQVLVQTLRGYVVALDPETGVTQWRAFLGRPYELGRALAANSKVVVAIRGERLYVLDRKSGAAYPYAPDPDTGLPVYGFRLHDVPATAPSADEDAVFVSYGDDIYAYLLPPVGPPAPGAKPKASDPLRFIWGAKSDGGNVNEPPVVTTGFLGLVSEDGTYQAGNKFEFDKEKRTLFKLDGTIRVPAGRYGDVAYIGTEDGNVYAMLVVGRVLWRLYAGSPIVYQPQVTDDDVFVTSERGGLTRVNRKDREVRSPGRDKIFFGGDVVWRNGQARRFLATNDRFVYAVDRVGRMLVLDYDRGTLLARFDTLDWKFPVSNPWTDRIFLAAQDGQIVCLHPRDSKTPVITKKVEPIKPPEEKKEKADEKKDEKLPEDKKVEEKKDDKQPEGKNPEMKDKKIGARRVPDFELPAVCWVERAPHRQRPRPALGRGVEGRL